MSNLVHFAQYAGAAYCNPIAGRPVLCKGDICPAGNYSNATVYSVFHGIETEIMGFIAIDSNAHEIILSIRGTSAIGNWLADVVWARQPTSMCAGCWAHFGFLFAYSEIASAAETSLASANRLFPSYKLTITGHSLGAAVATLLGMSLRDKGYDLDIYTYGSPRVGNQALASYISRQPGHEYRVTHNADVVTRLPPINREFRHTSPEYWLSPGPERRVSYHAGEVEECKGTANVDCSAGAPWWDLDITSHLYYLVAITQCGGGVNKQFHLDLSSWALGLGEGGRSGEMDLVLASATSEPVNATTATNSSVEGLKPSTVDTLAMYAKLDQEYASALAVTDAETKVVF
ncbi:Alpha/Beta hydrolase protein [Coniella lustricola]|uniref:Alpha/Beta hydrolase protein n=1 Tax=Coniella lustricola TaxID=2025994 RepID=A0A2T3ANW5_9PEZI|nr:Alpha/Beta hydrolase protein [Coniella lustricola]